MDFRYPNLMKSRSLEKAISFKYGYFWVSMWTKFLGYQKINPLRCDFVQYHDSAVENIQILFVWDHFCGRNKSLIARPWDDKNIDDWNPPRFTNHQWISWNFRAFCVCFRVISFRGFRAISWDLMWFHRISCHFMWFHGIFRCFFCSLPGCTPLDRPEARLAQVENSDLFVAIFFGDEMVKGADFTAKNEKYLEL